MIALNCYVSTMDLNKSADIWVQHCLQNINNIYGGHQIKGFKTGNVTKQAYEFIIQKVNNNSEITPENVNDVFYQLIIKQEPTEITDFVYNFLQKMIGEKILINSPASNEQLETLNLLKTEAEQIYNDRVIQNEIMDSQSSSNSNLLSQLILQINGARPNTRSVSQTLSQNSVQSLEQSLINSLTNVLNDRFNQLVANHFDKAPKPQSYDNCDLDDLKKILRARDLRLHKHNSIIQVFQKHLELKSAPQALHICNFPIAYLPNNSKLVDKHDKLIRSFKLNLLT